jgi:hypothetical protein
MNREDHLISVTYRPINTCKPINIEDPVDSSDGGGAHRHASVAMLLWKTFARKGIVFEKRIVIRMSVSVYGNR